MTGEERGSGREVRAAERPAWRRRPRPPGPPGNGRGSGKQSGPGLGADAGPRRTVWDSARLRTLRGARGCPRASPSREDELPSVRPEDKAHGGGLRRGRGPGALVGVRAQHLHGHQDGLVGTGVQGEILVFELDALHFAEVDLDNRQPAQPRRCPGRLGTPLGTARPHTSSYHSAKMTGGRPEGSWKCL